MLEIQLYQGFEIVVEDERGTVSETNLERTENEPRTNVEQI